MSVFLLKINSTIRYGANSKITIFNTQRRVFFNGFNNFHPFFTDPKPSKFVDDANEYLGQTQPRIVDPINDSVVARISGRLFPDLDLVIDADRKII